MNSKKNLIENLIKYKFVISHGTLIHPANVRFTFQREVPEFRPQVQVGPLFLRPRTWTKHWTFKRSRKTPAKKKKWKGHKASNVVCMFARPGRRRRWAFALFSPCRKSPIRICSSPTRPLQEEKPRLICLKMDLHEAPPFWEYHRAENPAGMSVINFRGEFWSGN